MSKSIDIVNQSTASGAAADAVFESIHSIMHRYRALQYRTHSGEARALTHMDSKVLGFFARHAGATQKDLVAHSGRDKGQLARLISGLKEQGLIEGQADEADRRNIRLQLTAQGRAAQRVLQAQARRVAQQAVANLSSDECRQLVTLLQKVRAGLNSPS